MLFLVVFCLLTWGMIDKRRVFEFPFHVGAVTFAFIIVQVPGLANDPFVPETDFIKTIGFMIVCLLMCWLGWTRHAKPFSVFRLAFSERRLLIVSALLSVLGAYFYYALSRLPGELTIAVQMTGVPVIYVFFSRLLVYGFAISILCLTRRLSSGALCILLFDLAFIVDRIVRSGSRADTTELIMICALAFWFHQRRAIPRWVALGGLIVGTLLMNSVGDYRTISKNNTGSAWEDIAEIDLLENTAKVWSSGGNEMRNAIQRVRYADERMEFDYGLSHWNNLVFSFIPAQLFGADVKSSLMISVPALARDYDPVLGTTETGLADAFQSFWFFGAVKFFLLAYVMRRIFASAEAGAFAGQFVYVMSVVPAMHAISHKTDWVLMVWVHMLLFAVPTMMFALMPQSGAHRRGHASDELPPQHSAARI